MDLGGPKPRTTEVRLLDPARRIGIGDTLLVRPTDLASLDDYPIQTACTLPDVLDQLQPGETIWIDDGRVGTQIEQIVPDGIVTRVISARPKGERLRNDKGLNFPDSTIMLAALTDLDRQALDFVIQHADLVGYSFVQDAADVDLLLRELRQRDPAAAARIGIIAKIETRRAVSNLPDIIVHAAGSNPFGVMIARGDLAVELGYQRLAEMQEELLWLCEAAHVPVIWATQVLESLVRKGSPSRAEVTDAASAVRAECVMLNKGPFAAAAVSILDDVLTRMQEHQDKKVPRLRALRSWGPA
jgi:pyruvate kinase